MWIETVCEMAIADQDRPTIPLNKTSTANIDASEIFLMDRFMLTLTSTVSVLKE